MLYPESSRLLVTITRERGTVATLQNASRSQSWGGAWVRTRRPTTHPPGTPRPPHRLCVTVRVSSPRPRRSPPSLGRGQEYTAPPPSRCAEIRTTPHPPCVSLARAATTQRLQLSLAALGLPRLPGPGRARPLHSHWCFRLAPPSRGGLTR